ncbi:hypothetical protein [Candidatus Villigracilis affinis]|uniref:hypothetical protein n=1 Tax=Candidatus Villigracilis affinis TaxID=3140682 RepID=UPI002A1D6F7B|nr:hypothetical protein [Anaerolineales bacterium]
MQLCRAGSVILLILVIWTYYAKPLAEAVSPFWNDKLLDILILIPAIGAAIAGTLVMRQFGAGEQPHRVWQAFAIGLWFWVGGEISGIVYDAIYIDTPYPDFRLVDIFWLLGYFYLGLSLYYQARLVYGAQKRKGRLLYMGLVGLAFLVAAGLTQLASKAGLGGESAWVILFITVLYPVFDLTEGTIAIWLSFLFGRGQWSRPWWGLILFALADSVNTFYWLGGYDLIPPAAQSAMDFVSLAAYPASYMVAGLALLSNYFILQYGAESGLLEAARKNNPA